MSKWRSLDEYNPKHCLQNRQEVDLYVHKHDITGEDYYRITDCYYDAELDQFLTSDHRIVSRILHGYHVTHFKKIELP